MTKEIETIALREQDYFTIKSGIAINPNAGMFWREGIRPSGSLPYLTPPDIHNNEIIEPNTNIRRLLNDDGIKHAHNKIIPPFSIVCIRSGHHCGKVAFATVSCAISSALFAIIVSDKNKLLPRYVFHMMNSQRNHIHLLGKGERIQHLFISEFKAISIPLLSIERQTEIIEKASLNIFN